MLEGDLIMMIICVILYIHKHKFTSSSLALTGSCGHLLRVKEHLEPRLLLLCPLSLQPSLMQPPAPPRQHLPEPRVSYFLLFAPWPWVDGPGELPCTGGCGR